MEAQRAGERMNHREEQDFLVQETEFRKYMEKNLIQTRKNCPMLRLELAASGDRERPTPPPVLLFA